MGQMLKGREGSSFRKSDLFCYNIVRLWVYYQKEDLSGTKTTKQNTQTKKQHPDQNDKWKAGSSEHQIACTMEKTRAKLQHL